MEETSPEYKLTAGAILAITIPISCALASIAWAISAYFIEREKQRTRRELARLGIETKSDVEAE